MSIWVLREGRVGGLMGTLEESTTTLSEGNTEEVCVRRACKNPYCGLIYLIAKIGLLFGKWRVVTRRQDVLVFRWYLAAKQRKDIGD